MWNAKETLKACRCCLSTAAKLERLTELMRKVFHNICGLKAEPNDGHPQYVCTECSAQLRKALALRRKTRRAHFILKQIFMKKKVITKEDVLKVNRHRAQLVSNNGLCKPDNSSIYSFLDSTEGIPKILDENQKPNTYMYGLHNEKQTIIGDSSTENAQKCVPEVQNNAAILVDIKPANYKELDRTEQEKQEQRKREEEEALTQIREEDNLDNNDTNDTNDDNNDTNETNDGNNDTNNDNNDIPVPPEIDLNDVFKDLKEPEEDSDYSLSEPEELCKRRRRKKYDKDKCEGRKGKFKEGLKDNGDPQVNAKAVNVYSGKLKRQEQCVNDWANNPKLLAVVGQAKIRHLSIDEQMKVFGIRKQHMNYTSARFKCSMCVKPFVSQSELCDHVKTDHGDITDIKCEICSGRFHDITDLELHQAWEHWYEYTCVCGQIKYTLEDLVTCCERKSHSPSVQLTCCERKLHSPNVQLKEEKAKQQYIMKQTFDKIPVQPHKWSETLLEPLKYNICKFCGMEFKRARKLQTHLSLEIHRAPHRKTVKCNCDVCGICLLNLEAMEYHFDSCHHHLYKCKGCQAILPRLDAIIHKCNYIKKTLLKMKDEELKKKHFCVACGATCVSQPLLLKHQLSVHRMIIVNSQSMGDDQYLCCKTYFTNERAYHTHLLNEGHEAATLIPLACVKCKILFTDEAEKNEHPHTRLKPPAIKNPASKSPRPTEFKCEFCQLICSSGVLLSRHKAQIHYEGHICDLCGKWVTKGSIPAHIKTHKSINEEEIYTCQFCSQKLNSAQKFVVHVIRNHTPKPFVCSICNRRKIDRYECKKHILEAHAPEKPFECTKCGLRFVTWERHDEHLKEVHQIIVKETIRSRKNVNYQTALCYPHMRLDGSGIPMDIIEKCGLVLLDYKEETKTELPPEKIADYFIFDETTVLGTVPKKQIKYKMDKIRVNEKYKRGNERRRIRRQKARLAKLGLPQQDPSENKMAAGDFNIKEEEEECEVENEIVLSYVRNEEGEFTVKFENKEPKLKIGNDVPVPSEMTNKQQSEAVPLEYGDAVIQSPNADIKRKHITQDTENSAKRVKYKETFVGTKTKPQTGKSLGIIDCFGDIVEEYTQNDLFLVNKTQVGKNKTYTGGKKTLIGEKNVTVETIPGSSETSVFNDPSGLVHQSKTSEYDTRLVVASGPEPNTNIKSGPSGSNNIASRPNYSSEVTDNVEETRLEIDAQDLAANYEIVEVDGVQYVNIDDVLYKVEYA